MNRKTNPILALLCFFLFAFGTNSQAQLQSVTVGIDGLTCSQCSYSVERSIRQLSFVSAVAMELNTNEAKVYLNKVKTVELLQIGKKVVEAGFSVRFLKIKLDIYSTTSFEDSSALFFSLNILNALPAQLDSIATFQVIDKRYCKKKLFQQWQPIIKARLALTPALADKLFVVYLPQNH